MRTFIILILYVLITILSIPLWLIEWIIRKFNPMASARIAQVIVKGVFHFVMWISGCKKTIVGSAESDSFYLKNRDQKNALCGTVDGFFELPVHGSR